MDKNLKDNRYKVIRAIRKTGGSLDIVADRVSYQTRVHKRLPAEAYRHELHIYQELSHPSYPALADAWEDSEGGHLIFEYFEGPTLEESLKQSGNMSEGDILRITADICEAILHLHTLRPTVIHLDLKPSNIVLRPGKKAGILDLGEARQLWVDGAGNAPVFGTAGYASPEQMGGMPPDERSDVYSLGRTMLRMMRGYKSHGRNRYRYSPALKKAVRRAADPDPARRYRDLTEMLSEIRRVNAEQTQKSGRKMLILGAAVFCALTAAFALGALQEISGRTELLRQSSHIVHMLHTGAQELQTKTDLYRSFHSLAAGGSIPAGREKEFAVLLAEVEEDVLRRIGTVREEVRSSLADGDDFLPEEQLLHACLLDLHGLCHLYLIHADSLTAEAGVSVSGTIAGGYVPETRTGINRHVRLLAETGLSLIDECGSEDDDFIRLEKEYFQECAAFETEQE